MLRKLRELAAMLATNTTSYRILPETNVYTAAAPAKKRGTAVFVQGWNAVLPPIQRHRHVIRTLTLRSVTKYSPAVQVCSPTVVGAYELDFVHAQRAILRTRNFRFDVPYLGRRGENVRFVSSSMSLTTSR